MSRHDIENLVVGCITAFAWAFLVSMFILALVGFLTSLIGLLQ